MKKMITSLFICLLTVFMSVSSICAYDTNKIDKAYQSILKYYQNKKQLETFDEIIAVEALGLEANHYVLPTFDVNQIKKSGAGAIGKDIVALTLIGKNPTNYEGLNLVDLMKTFINNDGSIQYSYGMSNDVWVLIALQTVKDKDSLKVADYIAQNINEDGGFWDYGFDENWNMTDERVSNGDPTGWIIGALSIQDRNTYKNVIEKAIDYLKNTQDEKGGFYNIFGTNADTQSCVLEGLLAYDKDMVMKSEKYDDAIDILLGFQNKNTGAFQYDGADSAYATQDAARCLGTYKNGSVVLKAQDAYQEVINKVDNNQDKPTKPSENQDEIQIENNHQSKPNNDTHQTELPKKDTIHAKPVTTSDNNNIMIFVVIAVVSAGVYLVLRKKK